MRATQRQQSGIVFGSKPSMWIGNDAILWKVLDGEVPCISRALVSALTAALWGLWGGLVKNAGQKEEDDPHHLGADTH